MVVYLVLRYLFGMRRCATCLDCNASATQCLEPCQNTFGSSAEATGGVLGRVDAQTEMLASMEAQKSAGSLHAHMQVFVQCLHQHTPLQGIFALSEGEKNEAIERILPI